jgi:hypothetical protein
MSATGTAWERTPRRVTQRAAREALKRENAEALATRSGEAHERLTIKQASPP